MCKEQLVVPKRSRLGDQNISKQTVFTDVAVDYFVYI